jgi:hypothetical protein
MMTDSTHSQPSSSSEQDSSKQDPSDGLDSSASTLRFPQILLDASFDSLLSRSYPTTGSLSSSNMDLPPRGPSSLSESWASISDAEFCVDDDIHSENTDVASLIDLHSTGDSHSVRDDEDTSSEIEEHMQAEHEDPASAVEEQHSSVIRDPLSLSNTVSTILPHPPRTNQITLNESKYVEATDAGSFLATICTKTFTPTEIDEWHLPKSQKLVGMIQMPLGRDYIRNSGRQTFKAILFRNQDAESLDQAILHKLADVQLASGPEPLMDVPASPSKYHVVPDTFGPGARPVAAAVVYVEQQLETIHYTTAKFNGSSISLGDRSSSKRTISKADPNDPHGTYVVSGAQLDHKDLAVVVVDDLSQQKHREFARASLAFARRHGIPSIAVLRHDDWLGDPTLEAFISDDLHVTVLDDSRQEDSAVRMLPIHLNTFLDLDAGQLSRHIRHLMLKAPKTSKQNEPDSKFGRESGYDIEKNVTDDGTWQKEQLRIKTVLDRFWPIAVWVILGILMMDLVWTGSECSLRRWTEAAEIETLSTQGLLTITSVHSHTQSAIAAVATADPSAPSTGPPSSSSDNRFDVQVLGGSHLIVKASREQRRQDTLQVSITRQGKPVSAEVKAVVPSVWSVKIDAEQAYGNLCVQLSTKRPVMTETVIVDLGQQPLDAWLKNLLEETEGKIGQKLAMLQDSLEHLQQQQRPQNLVKNAEAKLQQTLEQIQSTLNSPLWRERTVMLNEAVRTQAESLQKTIKVAAIEIGSRANEVARVSVYNGQAFAEHISQGFDRFRVAIRDIHAGNHFENLWQDWESIRSSTVMAAAQQRAQQVVDDLKKRTAKF